VYKKGEKKMDVVENIKKLIQELILYFQRLGQLKMNIRKLT